MQSPIVADSQLSPDEVINEFGSLGLLPDIVKALDAQHITKPTPVQRIVIPRLLARENLVMAASTGSGKTLAYALPAVQNLAEEEHREREDGSTDKESKVRQVRRPRCLILVPTRELARQVLAAVKQLGHHAKVSSTAVLGGEQYALQKKNLDRLVDIVVASPGRLMQHKEQGNVYLSRVRTVIIDEVDTMLTQGFGADIRAILRSVLTRASAKTDAEEEEEGQSDGDGVQLVMATATLTKAVKALLEEVSVSGKGKEKEKEKGKVLRQGFNIEFSDPSNKTPRKMDGSEARVVMKIVEVDGLHRSLPTVRHTGQVGVRVSTRTYRITFVFLGSGGDTRARQAVGVAGGVVALLRGRAGTTHAGLLQHHRLLPRRRVRHQRPQLVLEGARAELPRRPQQPRQRGQSRQGQVWRGESVGVHGHRGARPRHPRDRTRDHVRLPAQPHRLSAQGRSMWTGRSEGAGDCPRDQGALVFMIPATESL